MARQRSTSGWMGYGQFAPVNRNDGKDNPFADTMYSELWENNPYADMYYQPTFWDYVGLSNKAKDANNEYERLYNEYVAGIYQMQEQDKYNSPANQAKLEKEAGLNPDITGISGSGVSSGFTPPNAGMNPALNGASPAQNAIGVISSVLSFATNTLHQIESLQGLKEDNMSKSISNFDSFAKLAEPVITSTYAQNFSAGSSAKWEDVRDSFVNRFDSSSERKRAKKAFQYVLNHSQYTASRNAAQNLNDRDLAIGTLMDGVIKLQLEATKHGYKSDIAKLAFDTDYYSNMSGKSFATYDTSNSRNSAWLNKWRSEYYNKLYNQWKNGNILSGLILIGLGGSAIGSSTTAATSLLKMLK